MEMPSQDFVMTSLQHLSTLFVYAVGLSVLAVVVFFIIDISQTKDAVRHNYPVVERRHRANSNLFNYHTNIESTTRLAISNVTRLLNTYCSANKMLNGERKRA